MAYLRGCRIPREVREDLAQEAVLRAWLAGPARSPYALGRVAARSAFVDEWRAQRAAKRIGRVDTTESHSLLFSPEIAIQFRQAIRRLGRRRPAYTRAIEDLLHGEEVPTAGRDAAYKLRERALQALREAA